MNKEIKKLIAIVNCMKDSELLDNGEYYKVHSDFIISLEENKTQLLDYITNLQEENAKVHKELDYADNYNIYLISKIDKAIEYIKEDIYSEPNELYRLVDGEHLLNILQGDDKDETNS